jgi:hypothetical protein
MKLVRVCTICALTCYGSAIVADCSTEPVEPNGAPAHTLNLPGKMLYLTPLLKAKKFRKFGYKEGALAAFEELQNAKLGKLEELGAGKGTHAASPIKE